MLFFFDVADMDHGGVFYILPPPPLSLSLSCCCCCCRFPPIPLLPSVISLLFLAVVPW